MDDGNEESFGVLAGPMDGVRGNSITVRSRQALLDEAIKKEALGRRIATLFIIFLGTAATACLVFSLFVACHFIYGQEAIAKSQLEAEIAKYKALEAKFKVDEKKSPNVNEGSLVAISSQPPEALGNYTVKTFSQLLPASFSTALGLILFITMARFITAYVRPNKQEQDEKQDYGAISTLVQEIGSLIKSFKSGS